MKVEEVQGLYGPFSLSEKVLQRIWERGDFHQESLTTNSGKSLRVLDAGRWNSNEGPDFKEARLLIDGRELVGDVEIHFRASDWYAHAHDTNPNFRNVVLHVVLYDEAVPPQLDNGLELLVLMPLLERDLEDYAMEDALIELEKAGSADKFRELAGLPLEQRIEVLGGLAHQRWQQKLDYARKRLDLVGWEDCCHQSALEVLGYARNRATMNRIAARYSLADFSEGLDPEQLYDEFSEDWKLKGLRPANHPKVRLRQYSEICRARHDWPECLSALLATLSEVDGAMDTSAFRRLNRTKALQTAISKDVFSDMLGEKRLNTLLCDALFSMAAADGILEGEQHWRHWYPGDMPSVLVRASRELRPVGTPDSNGSLQGILGWAITRH